MSGRPFTVDSEEWVAWPSGGGAYGTGVFAPGNIQAIHFAKADAPTEPLLEALLPAGAFFGLFDDELVDLFRSARRIIVPDNIPARPVSRRLGDQS